MSQSKCRAVSHPPQRALSLDKSQRDSSGRKKECGKGQRLQQSSGPPHTVKATWRARQLSATLCSLTVTSGQVHNSLHVTQIQGSASCSGELHLQHKQELEQEQKEGSDTESKSHH